MKFHMGKYFLTESHPPINAAAYTLIVLQCKGLIPSESPILMLEA